MLSLRCLFALVALVLALAAPALAQDDPQKPLTIYRDSDKYIYQGCYNETVDIPGTAKDRALPQGINKVFNGNMTVPLCLSYCNENGFRFAGIEYSRECWCSMHLSSLSLKLPDSECNLPCDGNKAVACGGSWKLTVYDSRSVDSKGDAPGLPFPTMGLWLAAGLAYFFI